MRILSVFGLGVLALRFVPEVPLLRCMSDQCSLEVTRSAGMALFKLIGVAQASTARALHTRLLEELRAEEDVVIDLEGLERLDLTGVQLLLATGAWIGGHGRSLKVVVTSENPRRALTLSGALAHLRVEGGDSFDEATEERERSSP